MAGWPSSREPSQRVNNKGWRGRAAIRRSNLAAEFRDSDWKLIRNSNQLRNLLVLSQTFESTAQLQSCRAAGQALGGAHCRGKTAGESNARADARKSSSVDADGLGIGNAPKDSCRNVLGRAVQGHHSSLKLDRRNFSSGRTEHGRIRRDLDSRSSSALCEEEQRQNRQAPHSLRQHG